VTKNLPIEEIKKLYQEESKSRNQGRATMKRIGRLAALIGSLGIAFSLPAQTAKDEEIFLPHWREVVAEPQKTFTYYLTGNDLLKACQQPDGSGDAAYCTGFIVGVADVLGDTSFVFIHGGKATLESMVRTPCFPSGVTPQQLRDTVVKFLTDHPTVRHEPAESLVNRSFIEPAFSCHNEP
jgi:hypothetical protein